MSTCQAPGYYVANPTRTVIHETTPEALDVMAAQVKDACQVGKDAEGCHLAVSRYASHNQAAASGVYASSAPAPKVVSKLVHDVSPVSALNAQAYTSLVSVSNAQAAKHAATGEFHMWTVGPCNSCYYPTSDVQTASY